MLTPILGVRTQKMCTQTTGKSETLGERRSSCFLADLGGGRKIKRSKLEGNVLRIREHATNDIIFRTEACIGGMIRIRSRDRTPKGSFTQRDFEPTWAGTERALPRCPPVHRTSDHFLRGDPQSVGEWSATAPKVKRAVQN